MKFETDDLLISIIIPTYNRASLLRLTLESLKHQSYENFEVLVIDDGGTDNTNEVVEEISDSRIKYYWKENAERGAARNYGAALAKGHYLNFFDSDDIAYPNHLATAASFINQNNDIFVFHTGYDWKNTDMETIRLSVANQGSLNKMIYRQNILSCNNVFIRKSEFEELKFSEERKLSGTEDWLLWLRLASRYNIIGLPTITSAIIQHDMRSMSVATGKDTLQRTIAFEHGLKNDKQITPSVYKTSMAEMYYLTALYFIIEGNKQQGIMYAVKAIKLSPFITLSMRTLAIFKYLLK